MFARLKRVFIGQPLTMEMIHHEKIPKWKALAVLASDALSSVAYATEEILIALMAVSAAALIWSGPIALGITFLIIIVSLSYRQTIAAYPQGGGAYIVVKENLGTNAGLVVGAALLIDYILTVSVSVAAGIQNVASAFPSLYPHREVLCAVIIMVIMTMNLRGIRESSNIFALPTYFFLLSFAILIGAGIWNILTGQVVDTHPIIHETYPDVAMFLVLRAFASGCTALTGIEAISDGVSVFKTPSDKNARTTLMWMAGILSVLFLSITFLAHVYQIVPVHGQTATSLLAKSVFGENIIYYVIQFSTALILFLAANTAYADFPRLASFLAKDRFLPRQLASLGDRLVFSNGIIGLSMMAILLIFLFNAEVHYLVPLYAVGVFLSFTLSQTGMIFHHLKNKKRGWRGSTLLNTVGAITTFVVLIVISFSKFALGAWMVILAIPIFVLLFWQIHRHYLDVGRQLVLGTDVGPLSGKLKHTVIVPVSGIHRGVIDALKYAQSISQDVRACYVDIDSNATENLRTEWRKWAKEVPLVILSSPYRSVIGPLLSYIDEVEDITKDDVITIVIPEFVTPVWWHNILHNQTALLIRTALFFKPNKVVTAVRYHLKSSK